MHPYIMFSLFLFLPAMMLAMWIQNDVKSIFDKYSKVTTRNGSTAAEAANMILQRSGLLHIHVNRGAGHLADHYDTEQRVIRLSESVYGSISIASIGVAAHECGHAIQHNLGSSAFLMMKNSIVPAINLCANFALPLFVIGLLGSVGFMTPDGAVGFMTFGMMLFTGVIIFHLVTLPIEFNASSRALTMLHSTGALSQGELVRARAVLRAVAWTYIAATMTAFTHSLRVIMLRHKKKVKW